MRMTWQRRGKITDARQSKVMAHYSGAGIVEKYSVVGLSAAEEQLIDDHFRKNSKVLDIGCGAGRAAIELARRGYAVTGIDLVPEMIEAACRQAQAYCVDVEFKVMDAVELDFPDESFDNVLFLWNGFEHIPGKRNREEVLEGIYRILTLGGHAILSIRSGLAFGKRWLGWAVIGITYPWMKFKPSSEYDIEFGDKIWGGSYVHYIIPASLKSLAERIGFRVVVLDSDKNIVKKKRGGISVPWTRGGQFFYVLKKDR